MMIIMLMIMMLVDDCGDFVGDRGDCVDDHGDFVDDYGKYVELSAFIPGNQDHHDRLGDDVIGLDFFFFIQSHC